MRARPMLVRTAAVLCLVASSCSGDGGRTDTEASDTSSTLPSPESAAAGVGADVPDDTRPAPTEPASAVRGAVRRPGPSGTPTTISGTKQPATTTPIAGGTITTTTTVPPGLPPEKCPDAKTCRRYLFMHGNADATMAPRWPVGPDGFVTVHYSVNPAHSGLSDEQVRGAIAAAFATWQTTTPKLRFVFDGFTSRTPTLGDGHNDVGWAPSGTRAFPQNRDSVLVEADMVFALGSGNWTWEPCEQRDGSCTDTCVQNGQQTGCRSELQAIATHETGHWLWLGDTDDQTLDRELTMNPHPPFADRFRSTLALGDVLGVRALYPCSCPLPSIYAP